MSSIIYHNVAIKTVPEDPVRKDGGGWRQVWGCRGLVPAVFHEKFDLNQC